MEAGMKMYLFPHYKNFRNRTVHLANIHPDHFVLDYGCGIGLLEDFIVPKLSVKGKVIGVDIGRELIELARKRQVNTQNCEFHCIDLSGQLRFESETFDVVITSLALHLLDRTQKEIVLKEFRRILKTNGKLLLVEIGKPTSLFGYCIKLLTLHYWVKFWPYEINSIDSFAGKLPEIVRSIGFKEVKIIERMRGYIDFFQCTK
jgi:ubiquinone/menaquinone biosynthesis C-methylase UbiE